MSCWVLKDTLFFDYDTLTKCSMKTFKVCEVDWILNYNTDNDAFLFDCKDKRSKIFVRIKKAEGGTDSNFSVSHIFKEAHMVFEFSLFACLGIELEVQFYVPKTAKEYATCVDPEKLALKQTESASFPEEKEERENEGELSNDLNSLWQKGILSDVDIHCGSEVFKAHKAILSVRSTFFNAMFQTPMKESQENIVVVRDIRPEVLRIVLKYIYSGKIQTIDDSEMICEVMSAADLYNISGLKKICSDFFRSVLSTSNALRLLKFADLRDQDLKTDVIKFVSDNLESLEISDEWIDLQKQNSHLAMIVMSENIKKLRKFSATR